MRIPFIRKDDVDYDSVGFPFEGIKIKIDNADKEGIGEIIVKNNNGMTGYLMLVNHF